MMTVKKCFRICILNLRLSGLFSLYKPIYENGFVLSDPFNLANSKFAFIEIIKCNDKYI